MERLKDKIAKVEANAPSENKNIVQKITKESKRNEMRQISAKINKITYEKFTEICRLNGMSNNSCLNMIIAQYVRDNSALIEG